MPFRMMINDDPMLSLILDTPKPNKCHIMMKNEGSYSKSLFKKIIDYYQFEVNDLYCPHDIVAHLISHKHYQLIRWWIDYMDVPISKLDHNVSIDDLDLICFLSDPYLSHGHLYHDHILSGLINIDQKMMIDYIKKTKLKKGDIANGTARALLVHTKNDLKMFAFLFKTFEPKLETHDFDDILMNGSPEVLRYLTRMRK